MKGNNYILNECGQPELRVDDRPMYANWYQCVLLVDDTTEYIRLPFVPSLGVRIWHISGAYQPLTIYWDPDEQQFLIKVRRVWEQSDDNSE